MIGTTVEEQNTSNDAKKKKSGTEDILYNKNGETVETEDIKDNEKGKMAEEKYISNTKKILEGKKFKDIQERIFIFYPQFIKEIATGDYENDNLKLTVQNSNVLGDFLKGKEIQFKFIKNNDILLIEGSAYYYDQELYLSSSLSVYEYNVNQIKLTPINNINADCIEKLFDFESLRKSDLKNLFDNEELQFNLMMEDSKLLLCIKYNNNEIKFNELDTCFLLSISTQSAPNLFLLAKILFFIKIETCVEKKNIMINNFVNLIELVQKMDWQGCYCSKDNEYCVIKSHQSMEDTISLKTVVAYNTSSTVIEINLYDEWQMKYMYVSGQTITQLNNFNSFKDFYTNSSFFLKDCQIMSLMQFLISCFGIKVDYVTNGYNYNRFLISSYNIFNDGNHFTGIFFDIGKKKIYTADGKGYGLITGIHPIYFKLLGFGDKNCAKSNFKEIDKKHCMARTGNNCGILSIINIIAFNVCKTKSVDLDGDITNIVNETAYKCYYLVLRILHQIRIQFDGIWYNCFQNLDFDDARFLQDFNVNDININDLNFVYKMQERINGMECFRNNKLNFNVNVQDRIRLVLGLVVHFLYIFEDHNTQKVFYSVYEQCLIDNIPYDNQFYDSSSYEPTGNIITPGIFDYSRFAFDYILFKHLKGIELYEEQKDTACYAIFIIFISFGIFLLFILSKQKFCRNVRHLSLVPNILIDAYKFKINGYHIRI